MWSFKMKKLLLAVLVAGAGINAVQAAPTVYGELDVSVDQVDVTDKIKPENSGDSWKVNSNNSLIGIKGEESLTDVVSVVYLAEWTVNGDGDGTDLAQRNRYVGLGYKDVGTLKIGKLDSYVKSLGTVDLFNNYAANAADINGTLTGENRINNVVAFESAGFKVLGGTVQANVFFSPGEDVKTDNATLISNGNAVGDDLANAWSSSLNYKNDDIGFAGGVGFDKSIPSRWLAVGSGWAKTDILRASGSYKIKPIGLTLIALLQRAEVASAGSAADKDGVSAKAAFGTVDQEDSFVVGGALKVPNFEKLTLKAQYQQSTTSFNKGKKDYDIDQISVGADYALNSKARTYVYLAQNTKDNGVKDAKTNYGGIGLEYKF
jgi:predicted porin